MKPAGEISKINLPQEPSAAVEVCMDQYGTAVLRTAYFYVGDRHLAEDVSQEVFLRAFQNWSNFRGESSVKTWLTKITINLCKDKMSRKSFSEQPADPTVLQMTRNGTHNLATHISGVLPRSREIQSSAEDEVLRRLQKTAILQYVLALPVHYREVIYLYYYLDLSTKEIAETIGDPEGTIRGRLHRARELLGQKMKKEVQAE